MNSDFKGASMKDLVIIGAGGLGREVAQLVNDINRNEPEWNLLGFIDDDPQKIGMLFNNTPVLGDFNWFAGNTHNKVYAVCAIGNALTKKNVLQRVENFGLSYPNLIHPSVIRSDFLKLGTGLIICANSILSVNVELGNHVIINPGCRIGHDSVVRDYVSLMWDVTLSGNVVIKEGCEVGSKSVIIQQKTVGCWSIIGAGAAVVDDIPANCTAVGVPAKVIKRRETD
jgi:sugar O-acyltransferase (sialic acid O-acetyltransferase NeuD family)